MAPSPVPALITAIYNPCKDLFLYVKGERQDIKDLEKRISELTNNLSLIRSAKVKIDRSLKNSAYEEESEAFTVTKSDIAVITKKYVNFISKYAKSTTNQLSSTTELNVSTMALMIHELEQLKTKVLTLKFLKLAKLSRDIADLSEEATAAVGRLNSGNMTQKKSEPIQEEFGDDGNDLPVFNKYVDEVLEYLREVGNKVGISGRKGVGKTIVLRKLHDRLIEQKSLSGDGNTPRLDKIILIKYPTETDANEIVKVLQNDIILQLNIHDYPKATESTYKNASIISAFLSKRKYILLMDQVSMEIKLHELGLTEKHEYKKVVICSREKTVISQMTEHVVEVQGLETDDAWELFHKICGKLLNDSRKIAIAHRIIECCGGVAGLIHRIAHHLKDKEDDSSWNYAMDILQSKKSLELIDLEDFDKFYEMAYLGLAGNIKECLLYGALFPHKHEIYADYLIECWIAEGLIVERCDQKVRLNREVGRAILDRLTELYLLKWYNSKKNVMMPPDFRRVAMELGYAKEDKCVFWVPSKDTKPDTDAWAAVTRMSLIGCKVELPHTPKCPNICTLLLQSLKPNLEHLAATFFFHMGSLQVLNLNHTEIRALPKSINKLGSLKSLYLNGCPHLVALPPEAANLEKLEFLDISGTSISTLPQEIRFMVNMRCLRASLSTRGGDPNSKGKQVVDSELIIPPGIISNLRNLEELSIDTDLGFQLGIAVAKTLAAELVGLEHLNTLCFNFPNVSNLDTFVTQSKALNNTETRWSTHTFRSFKIFVGSNKTERSDEPDLTLAERWLRCSTNENFSTACKELLKQASAFEIIGHDELKSFTCSQFDLHSVKVCVVERCKNLENIVDGYITTENQGNVEESLLQNLEKLYLYDLKALKCIWDGPGPHTRLTNLTAITIVGCHKLTKILDPALACSLQSLEYLKVDNCRQISNIMDGRVGTSDIVEILKSLRKIELLDLPELENICTEITPISWKSLKSIIVMRCSKLINLSLTRTNAKKLASIECEESWWNTLTPDEPKQFFLPLCLFKEKSIQAGAQSRGEASTSGSSGSITEHNTSINPLVPSNINVDFEGETTLSDTDLQLQASQKGVKTDSSSLEDGDIKVTNNHQPLDHDHDHNPYRPGSSSNGRPS